MDKMVITKWIIDWFANKANIENYPTKKHFFDDGILNSFKTIELISDIESFFQIALPDSALIDQRFSNIDGLADIVYEIKGETK